MKLNIVPFIHFIFNLLINEVNEVNEVPNFYYIISINLFYSLLYSKIIINIFK